MFDKKAYAGGHTATHSRDGFVFDEGPHVSFTKQEKIKQLFAEAVNNDYLSIDAYIDNYWQGQSIRHPVITNIHGMPRDLVVKCISDFVKAQNTPNSTIANYEDWLVASYGRIYAEAFPMQYAWKYHATRASNPKFLRAPGEFVFARQALGMRSGCRFLSTAGSAGAARTRAVGSGWAW